MPIKERNLQGKINLEVDEKTFTEFHEERKYRKTTLKQLFLDAWESYKKEIGGLEQRKEKK